MIAIFFDEVMVVTGVLALVTTGWQRGGWGRSMGATGGGRGRAWEGGLAGCAVLVWRTGRMAKQNGVKAFGRRGRASGGFSGCGGGQQRQEDCGCVGAAALTVWVLI